ncbi:Spy/CpxP family protein refolding chaperone [Oceanicoccus sp. KOV_DT_Chl]|uniref:Spy/CpxP family protein refolding chaperone n=1 Tax=Oceanicoccus sp. KOV_DT_Chl TaxID=1904639 RepID=UPI000C7DE038|nr:Spy/CpxP family protein refolding chaperone [Oceanicoccus sp. KOV_DT_Chl]
MRTLIICLALSLFSITGLAGDRQDKMLHKLTKKLDLTEQQVVEVKSIMDEQQAERKEIRKAMEALHAATVEKMSVVLTPEQLEKFKRMEKKRDHKKDKHKDHHHDNEA